MAESGTENILALIRDNLLKPMAAEIKAATDASREKILLNQKKNSVLLWFLLIGTIINFCGIVIILCLLVNIAF